jgi:hypothetical protein
VQCKPSLFYTKEKLGVAERNPRLFYPKGKKSLSQSVIEPYTAPRREPVLYSIMQDLDKNTSEQEV